MNLSPRHFGTGWISGTASVALASIGLFAVFCFHFPSLLTIPDVRPYYPLPLIFTTPQFHHWHHGAEPEAIDKNFAVHVPLLDMLFGTFFIPGERWPSNYGVHGEAVPKGFLAQFFYPFKKSKPD